MLLGHEKVRANELKDDFKPEVLILNETQNACKQATKYCFSTWQCPNLQVIGDYGGLNLSGAKTECETLMSSTLPFAQQMLSEHGEFFPYGGAMEDDGKIVTVSVFGGVEKPDSNQVILQLKDAFVAGARMGKYRATALVYDVRVKLPPSGEISDAIAVSLNHKNKYSVIVMFPYKIDCGKLAFAPPYAQKGEDDIF